MNIWLVNAGDSQDTAWTYIDRLEVEVPNLLDSDQAIYSSYFDVPNSYAPFPLQFVIDRDGIVTYANGQYDAAAVKGAIDAALAE